MALVVGHGPKHGFNPLDNPASVSDEEEPSPSRPNDLFS